MGKLGLEEDDLVEELFGDMTSKKKKKPKISWS